MKVLVILTALAAIPLAVYAVGPIQPLDRIIIKTEQFKGVSYALEQRLGRQLTADEKAELARNLIPNGPIDTDPDKLIIKVANGGSKALLCVKTDLTPEGVPLRAVCISPDSGRTYDLIAH